MRTAVRHAVPAILAGLVLLPPAHGGLAQDSRPGMVALPEPDSPFIAFNIWIGSGSAAKTELPQTKNAPINPAAMMVRRRCLSVMTTSLPWAKRKE